MKKLSWSDNMKKVERGNRVVLANAKTGNWFKISKECYSYLDEAVDRKETEEQLIQKFGEREDRQYIGQLIDKIKDLELWETEKERVNELGQVYFLLTNRCNLNCIHCSMNAAPCKAEDYLNTDQIMNALKTVIKLKPRQIVLS